MGCGEFTFIAWYLQSFTVRYTSSPPLTRFHLVVRPNRQSLVLAYTMPGSYFTPTNKHTRQTSSTNTLNRHHHQTHNIHNSRHLQEKHTQQTYIITKHTLPTSTEIFNKHVPHINRHPVQVHSNFQFTPELASSHREWSFSTAILINQGSSSQGKTSGCQTPQTPQTYPKQFHQTTSQDPHSESSPGNVLVSVNNSGFPQACLPWYSPVSCKEC